MSDITYIIAEKVIKVIAAVILREEELFNSSDISSLCNEFFRKWGNNCAKRTQIELDSITLDTDDMLQSILRHSPLSEESCNAILISINEGLERSNISTKLIVDNHNNHKRIAEILFDNCLDKKHMTQSEEEVLQRCCNFISKTIITAVADQAIDFHLLNYAEIYKQFRDLKENLAKEMQQYLEMIKNQDAQSADFEARYLQIMAQNHNHVELFTSKIGNHFTKHYQLDVAYIELALQSASIQKTKRITIGDIFGYGDRWLIQGDAGCGKTTLLQWIILNLAKDNLSQNADKTKVGYFPVLVTLRKIKDWNRLSIKQFISEELHAYDFKIPSDLLHSLNNSGRKLLLLIDGLDEIDDEKRQLVLTWVERLIDTRNAGVSKKIKERDERLKKAREKNPQDSAVLSKILKERYTNDIRILFTSRPIMSEEFKSSLKVLAVKQASVLPMTYRDVCTFIDYWHNAINVGRQIKDEEISDKAELLKQQVNSNESIAKLAQNPLLCAMICALHFSKEGILPKNRLDLYDACCRMLLTERDQLRTVRTLKFNKIKNLEYDNMRRILGDLALWMLECEGSLLIRYSDAVNHLKNKLLFMKVIDRTNEYDDLEEKATLIIDYFIERGGILRWIEEDKIGFIHKTFQEYYAAHQIYLESSWHLLMTPTRALSTNWRETILLAISFSNKDCAERVITFYLEKGGNIDFFSSKQDPDINKRMMYRILAINCAAEAKELSQKTLDYINDETRAIIPPSGEDQIKGLSSCGNLVVPLLAYKPEYSANGIRAITKVLMNLGTAQALAQMVTYLDKECSISYEMFNLHRKYLTKDAVRNSNIVPSYVHAIIKKDVNIEKRIATVSMKAVRNFEWIADLCEIDKSDSGEAYVLSDIMRTRLRTKHDHISELFIENHFDTRTRTHQTIMKILELFSISRNIEKVTVTYDGSNSPSEIELFCSIICRYKKLKNISVYGLTPTTKVLFSDCLKNQNIETVFLKEHRNKE